MWTPIDQQTYYTVTVTSMMVGGQRLNLDCSAYNSPAKSIVDSGTTVLNVPQPVFDAIVSQLVEPLMSATGASAGSVNAFLQGNANLDVPQWRFVQQCSASSDEVGLHCADSGAPLSCHICLNITAYNLAIEAVAQLPSISIGFIAENSTDYEFFLDIPPMQCVATTRLLCPPLAH
jgi:hypothetical protein